MERPSVFGLSIILAILGAVLLWLSISVSRHVESTTCTNAELKSANRRLMISSAMLAMGGVVFAFWMSQSGTGKGDKVPAIVLETLFVGVGVVILVWAIKILKNANGPCAKAKTPATVMVVLSSAMIVAVLVELGMSGKATKAYSGLRNQMF